MEKELLPNNTTLASLRELLKEARKNVPDDIAVRIDLSMWHYSLPPTGGGATREKIGVYKGGTEDGTKEFKSIEEARKYIEGWKEEEDNANTTS
jgi:L-alanine-DL-glutamate epimerase-like enolase superfamily enzyme